MGGPARATSAPAPIWREGRNPRTHAIEITPIVMLYNGVRSGGLLYRKGLQYAGAPAVYTWSRKNRPRNMEKENLEKSFQKVVRGCTRLQRETHGLYRDLKTQKALLHKDLGEVSDRLQIMRSMPDLTVSPQDCEEFVQNVLAQPKLKPPSGEEGMRMTGSLQSIFPLRDWARGGAIKQTKH